MKKIALILFLLSLGSWGRIRAEEPAAAVREASPEKGLRLSEKALETLEVALAPVRSVDGIEVPIAALVYYQDHVGVYRKRGDWFKLVDITILGKSEARASIRCAELKGGDEVAVKGAPLLRVAEMEAFGGGE
jgi:hypothetical protein